MEQDSSNEGTLKVEGNNETSSADVGSGKKSRSSSGRKLDGENISGKSSTGSSTLEGNSSKGQNVCSVEDKVSNERRKKKKVVDPKFLKYYPNVPGEETNRKSL